ncbi:MAG TPA: TonB-dependent receptor plug domain-containing protein [Thermoanaerobaculia bacterium]
MYEETAAAMLSFLLLGACASLPEASSAPTPVALKKLTLRELMDVEVTSVSRGPSKLSHTAASIQVITRDDIHRSGATTLAEALRLAPNLQIAQTNSHDWAITARGFNGASVATGSIANKLLVMIDGRSVYTPLFGGVFWDAQHVPLDDIDRIEVVSGPGGTLWGANAVNGVINIITRSAEETQGGRVTLAAGSFIDALGMVRYGGAIGRDFTYRVYGQFLDAGSTKRANGADAHDDWTLTQGGMRADYRKSDADRVTVQADFYDGDQGIPSTALIDGQNVMARWTHVTSPQSDWLLQFYYDRTGRRFAQTTFREELRTADLDFQHRFAAGARNSVLWGAGYRHMWDEAEDGGSFSFRPLQKTMRLFSAFVQDELTTADAALKLTIGAKLEHNEFSGLETQPSVRLAWTPPGRQMAWAAASRAVRSPSRLDTEIRTGPTRGSADFASENVIAYEIGYRVTPAESLSLSVAAFHNSYTDIRSINQNAVPPGGFLLANDQEATTFGIELAGAFQPTAWWRLRGGFTHLEEDFRSLGPQVLAFSAAFEAQDPQNRVMLQSVMDLPRGVQLDVVARHVAALPATLLGPTIPAYTTADVRLAWSIARWELAAIARNLAGDHPEFNSPVLWYEIPPSIQGRLTFTW